MKQLLSSFAKITRPLYFKILTRKRLFAVLDKSRSRHSVLYLSASAGSGKTTLLSSYLHARNLPCLWYSVDSGDDDIATFFYYMGLAVKKAAPLKKKPMPCLTPEYRQGVSAFTRRYFEEVYGRLKRPACLVFDDYHEASVNSQLHEIILGSLEMLPEGVSIVFLSRNTPPPAFARLRANNLMEILDQEKLYLTPDETLGIMRLYGIMGKYSEEACDEIYRKTNGWAAGVHLMLEPIRKGKIDAAVSIKNITMDTVFDYFDSEILKKLDDGAKGFLLKTSILPSIDSSTAERLTGLNNAGQLLSDMSRGNCFTEKRNLLNPTYQYHPLFREFLLSRIKDLLTQPEKKDLQIKAAQILSESEKHEDAFELFKDAGDWDGLVNLVLKHAKFLSMQGRYKVIEEWIMNLPKDLLSSAPWLLYWLGVCRLPFNQEESRSYSEQAFGLFKRQKDAAGLFLTWCSIVNTFPYERENLTPLEHWIPILNELMKQYPSFPSKEIEARVTFSMFVSLVLWQTGRPETYRWAERAWAIAKESSDISLRVNTGFYTAVHNVWTGDFQKNGILIEELRKEIASSNTSPLLIITIKLLEALHCWLTVQPESCKKAVHEGLQTGEKNGVHVWDNMLLNYGIEGAMAAGDTAAAKTMLQQAAASMKGAKSLDIIYFHELSAWHAMITSNLPLALSHMETASSAVKRLSLSYHEAIWHLGMVEIMFMQSELNLAGTYLEKACKTAGQMNSDILKFSCMLAEARFSFYAGNEKAGIKSLKHAMVIGRKRGYLHFMWWQPAAMSELCAKALEHGVETEYVKMLIRKRKLTPHQSAPHLENWPYPVKIYTLGKFEIWIDGKPVEFSGKVQKKPLEMLKAIIAFGGEDVPVEKIADKLWPDVDGDMAHNNFKMTLSRLRKLLCDRCIEMNGGMVSLNPRMVWVDALAKK
ncbi:MAG: hypothetical protein HZB81_03350 [Deltaproteobacteria bacterium]|nr:hypothetical protein [Deltaproteobacteria bacterium]